MWVEWIEPFGVNNEPVYCRIKTDVAIALQKKMHPPTDNFGGYESDEQALEDFIVVHWAELREDSCFPMAQEVII